jgi:hypothetical protein
MVLEYSNIVVGSSLNAVLFAFNNKYPLFFESCTRPFRFDYLEPDIKLDFLKLARTNPKSLTMLNDEKSIGIAHEFLWERLLFIMSITGSIPLSDMCRTIRHDTSKITCFNEYSKIAEIRYKKMYNFKRDDKKNKFLCRDWIAFNSGGKHNIDLIETSDDFVNQIWFYPSDRICGNTKVKDACAVSVVDKERIDDFEFSQTMARFKVVKDMKDRGMKGLLSSYGPNGNPKHYDFKTSIISRSLVPYGPVTCYDQYDMLVKVPSFNETLRSLSKGSYHYRKILRHL